MKKFLTKYVFTAAVSVAAMLIVDQADAAAKSDKGAQAKVAAANKDQKAKVATANKDVKKPATDPNTIVAKVGSDVVRESDIDRAASSVPADLAQGFTQAQFRATVLRNLVRQILLTKEAKNARMDQDPAVRKDVQSAVDRVIAQAYLVKALRGRITPSAIQLRYNSIVTQFKKEKEYKVAFLVCDTEANVKAAHTALKSGDFVSVAKKYSVLPEQVKEKAAEGMFVLKMVLPKEVQDELAKLKPGEHSEPVKTDGGFYIIRYIEFRDAKIPTLQESAQHIQMLLVQEQTEKFLSEIEKKSNVVYYQPTYEKEIREQDRKMEEARKSVAAPAA